jgi:predicted ATPase/DNA-binding winged helix-turn-helix (wHTH) protein
MRGVYSFDRCELRSAERQLLIEGVPAVVGARAFDLLVTLIERRDRVVSKAELFEAVWPGLVVEENNLQVQVSSLRKLLGPNAIATVAGRGYRFVAPLDEQATGSPLRGEIRVHPNNNLRQWRTRFIGREAAMADCATLLRENRLLTLTGIGGCGKTRLAQELAQHQLAAFPDGVWFVDLGPLQEAERVAATVAATLGLQDGSGPLERLADHLKSRRTLLVLDNCEHVIDAVVESIEKLLGACAGVKVVATSREALGMAGEQVFAVRSLTLPTSADLDEMRRSEAVRLFVDRARLVLPDFDLDDHNASAIAEICRRIDGIALAIELAAARVRVLAVEDIRARLDDRFRLLTGGNRAIPRHQTLQATMQWSYGHLAPAEQRLFRRLAVFAGGSTLAAATQVAGDTEDEYDVLERLTALHDKSLLLVDRDTQAQPRYRMLETVRQYAQERLNEVGEGDEVRTRHLLHYVDVAEQAAVQLEGPRPQASCEALRYEQENLLAALAWCPHASQGGDLALRLIGSAWRYWKLTAQPECGDRLARAALDLAGEGADTSERCSTLNAVAVLSLKIGRYDDALAYGQRCLAMARRLQHAALIADGLTIAAVALHAMGDEAQALARYSEASEIARSINDGRRLSCALNGVAEVHRGAGNFVAAEALYEESIELSRADHDDRARAVHLSNLASLLVTAEKLEQARTVLAECMAVARTIGYKGVPDCSLDVVAALASSLGNHPLAARFHGAALERMHKAGSRREPVDEALVAPRIALSRAFMGAAAFDGAEAEGIALSYEASVAEADDWLEQSADRLSHRALWRAIARPLDGVA